MKDLRARSLLFYILMLFLPFTTQANVISKSQNIKTPKDWNTFLRLRFDLSGKPVITWWKGVAYAKLTNQKLVPLMGIEGFNIGKLVPRSNGNYQWQSREVQYYTDLKTHEILSKWDNPFTNETDKVLDVANDPVNFANVIQDSPLHFTATSNGYSFLNQVTILDYPNPLPVDDFPEESTGPNYLASENFTFSIKNSDIQLNTPSIPMRFSWMRTSPWLPWMKMGNVSGNLIFVASGTKLDNVTNLPKSLLSYTKLHHKKFLAPPKRFKTPNETSWTFYKKWKKNHPSY
ncbi:DUF1838 family protein [Parashewanella tropica]|uniref:DUF1838 family protein n=1 Tax=Parashewanella tropica TaxID=2547970 RepID=UPI0010597852|nr:DUF1838 family protein [Parashewanella tropica]